MCSCREIVTYASAGGGGALTPGAAVVCEGVEVARTNATAKGKVECVQRFFDWTTGSPNIYELVVLNRRDRAIPSC